MGMYFQENSKTQGQVFFNQGEMQKQELGRLFRF